MKAYFFHEGTVPPEYQLDFEESLFNQQNHRALQTPEGWHSFYILNSKYKKIRAAIHFHIDGIWARSPLRSSFGSLEFSNNLPAKILFDFVLFFEFALKSKGVKHIRIKSYPQIYKPYNFTLFQAFLINLKYSVSQAEISSVIKITAGNARENFHRSERRKLDKTLQAGLIFKPIPIGHLDEVYMFIQTCRRNKNYSLSMTLEGMRLSVGRFPNHYLLFGVFDNENLVAASICILVKQNILYDFYHDHSASYDHLSPITLLVAEMYNYCKLNNIGLLDMGTSSINGIPNFGLLHFKNFLGGKPTAKFTFEKNL